MNNRKNRQIKPKTRRKTPIVVKEGKNMVIKCPFCTETHPIFAGQLAKCGTTLELQAVKYTYNGRMVQCAICGQYGGTMIKVDDVYKHDYDCKPGVQLAHLPEKSSKTAEFVGKMPEKVALLFAKVTGREPVSYRAVVDGMPAEEILGWGWRKYG